MDSLRRTLRPAKPELASVAMWAHFSMYNCSSGPHLRPLVKNGG